MQLRSGLASRLLMGFAVVIALVSGVVYTRLPWRPSGDFDIIGVLFVMLNLPKLAVGAVFGFSVALLIGAVLRVLKQKHTIDAGR